MLKILLPGATNWLYVTQLEHVAFAADFAAAYGNEMTKENTQIVSRNPEINELIEKYQPQAVLFKDFMFQIFRVDSHFDCDGKITKQYIDEIERTCREPEKAEELIGW